MSVKDTNPQIEAANIVGNNITLNVSGGIGVTDGSVEIKLLDPGDGSFDFNLVTDDPDLVLVSAERSDVTYLGNVGFDFDPLSGISGGQITLSATHDFQVGDPVVYRDFGGANVGGLGEGMTYYVQNVNGNTFELSTDTVGNNLVTSLAAGQVGSGPQRDARSVRSRRYRRGHRRDYFCQRTLIQPR